MHVVDQVHVRPLTVTTAEVSWSIQPSDEPITRSRFTVLRAESPEGPYVDVSGPLVNTFVFVDKVNLKSKLDRIGWRIRVDHVPTGVSVTYPNGTPDESFRYHPDLERAADREGYNPDYVALEIVRRNNLLLRRFTGRLVAYCPVRWQGPRCRLCYDRLKQRSKRSACNECYGTTFQGGYYAPIPVHVDFNPSPNVVQIANFGKLEISDTVAWMSNFPAAKPSDMLVEKTGARWRVVQVNGATKSRYLVQQYLKVEEIERSDPEYLFPVDVDFSHPAEDFAGFFPKKFSPKAVPTEGSGLL